MPTKLAQILPNWKRNESKRDGTEAGCNLFFLTFIVVEFVVYVFSPFSRRNERKSNRHNR